MSDWQEVEIKDGATISYAWRTDSLGKAEFHICPIWKRGKLVEVCIYPAQQEYMHEYWVLRGLHCETLQVMSWSHKGVEEPRIWLFGWCKDHKCMTMSVYVPPFTTHIEISIGSTLDIIFDK